jgi:hypothetical protein
MVPFGIEAQQRRAFSCDATIGRGGGHTEGEYRGDRGGVALDALLALRLRPAGSGALVGAVSAGIQGPYGSDARCVLSSTGGCVPSFPPFATLGALVGWQNASATLRASAGPAYVGAAGYGSGAVALQGRADGAVPLARHLALVASVRGTFIPNYRGDAFELFAFGAGVRIR